MKCYLVPVAYIALKCRSNKLIFNIILTYYIIRRYLCTVKHSTYYASICEGHKDPVLCSVGIYSLGEGQ